MSIYDTEFSRRIRSSVPASPSRSPARNSPLAPAREDVFGGLGLSPRHNDRRSRSPSVIGKGKQAATRDYGDRFIPTRDGTNLHATYQLLIDGNGASGSEVASKPKTRRKSAYGQGGETDLSQEQAANTFGQLLKVELFSQSQPTSRSSTPSQQPQPSPSRHSQLRRPMTFNNSSLPNLPSGNYPISSAGTTPLHHHPPPGVSGAGGDRADGELSPVSTLPPLPMHAPSTPTSGHGRPPGAGPSSSHHRAHQSQVALTSTNRTGTTPPSNRKSAFSPPPTSGIASPSTPTKKRLLNFQSPGTSRMAAFTGLSSGLNGTSGLDDMAHDSYSLSPVGRESQKVLLSPRKGVRQMSRTPFKVLDAPDLADDFYLNLVSWSQSNVLSVGLNNCVYLWSAQSSKVTKLCDLSATVDGEEVGDVITGLEWTQKGSTLAIGTNRGSVQIWDAEYCKLLRTMTGHTGRVGCLAWNQHILSTGSRDRTILHRDTRVRDPYIRRLSGHHKQEVCGLRWNTDTDQLASGGNDNKLYVWGGTDARPTWRFGEHRAAVKAIAWSPHQRGVLASGGGTADKKIRFWNSLTGGLVSEWDTGSQVCNLMWSKNSNELVSTHGYSGGPIQNQINIWRYPSMTQVATLTGHTYRVLYLAMSPDGQTIVTGAGDETLRFWNAFQKGRGERKGEGVDGLGVVGGGAGLNPFAKIR